MIADIIANTIDAVRARMRQRHANQCRTSIEVAKRSRQMHSRTYFNAWTPMHASTLLDHLNHQTFGKKNNDPIIDSFLEDTHATPVSI